MFNDAIIFMDDQSMGSIQLSVHLEISMVHVVVVTKISHSVSKYL